MDRQQIGLRLALKALGREPQMDSFTESFNDRLILQKTVYLAQAKGVHLGYYYKWYLRGPYCSSLTKDLYAIDSEGKYADEECTRWNLDKESSKRLKEMADLLSEIEPEELVDKLELLASVHFLVDREQVKGRDVKQINTILKRYDKHFPDAKVEEALGVLDDHGLFGN